MHVCLRRAQSSGITGVHHAGCSKRPDFSPAQPRRLLHPPTLSPPRQPLYPRTRLAPIKAAASEEARRYVPRFVWAVRPCNGSWRTEKPPRVFPTSEKLLFDVEPLSEARTPHGRKRVSARWGGAGEKSDFFSILLGLAGGGQGLVDFPDEAPFNFRDFLRAHAEDTSTLGQFFEVGLDAEPGDIRGERLKRQDILIP